MKKGVPVEIITGYLGSGKTTLLKNIIGKINGKVAILMNEFGEIGFDSNLIKGNNIEIKELLNGCVCCSLNGEFEAAIYEILEKVKPEMIIVETTGIAEPDSMITNIDDIKDVYLDSVITIIDAEAFIKYPKIGHTGQLQITGADIMILNKLDIVTIEDIPKITEIISKMNPKAKIIKTTYSNVNPTDLFLIGFERNIEKKNTIHEPKFIETIKYESERTFNRSYFTEFIIKLPKEIYRLKGYVKFKNSSYFINYVNKRYEFTKTDEFRKTELIFIGEKINKLKYDIIKQLNNCNITY